MAEREDDKLAERYRALGREEPPAGLDARILAAARRAAGARPPLRRWALPLSLAAVIVLSVTVTLQMQHERPQMEEQPAAPAQAESANQVQPKMELKAQKPVPAAVPAAEPAPAAGRLSRESADRERFERAAPAAAEERARQLGAEESPERRLARIAELRRAGRDDEADRLLAEFRRRYPDYRIPEAMLKEVERR
jgi:hypothetical protein